MFVLYWKCIQKFGNPYTYYYNSDLSKSFNYLTALLILLYHRRKTHFSSSYARGHISCLKKPSIYYNNAFNKIGTINISLVSIQQQQLCVNIQLKYMIRQWILFSNEPEVIFPNPDMLIEVDDYDDYEMNSL